MIIRLALASMRTRRLTVSMTILTIALSITLFLGVEKIRQGARSSFTDTISGTSLIIGARSGSVQLLLYSVFRIGNATNNISWDSYKTIAARNDVKWSVPISLGDSHRQFRVMGTTQDFFTHYRYRQNRQLTFTKGTQMNDLFDAVIGQDVAKALNYKVGDPIVVSHGLASFTHHDELPFRISGILAKTGTPVDRTVIVSLKAIEAIHVDWKQGAKSQNTTPVETIRAMKLRPKAITAALIGVKSPLQTFKLQRAINTYKPEPLLAILPGVALQELWSLVGVAETALFAVSAMVVATALIGMMAVIFSSLSERRREMAIYRAMGARPVVIFALLVFEAMVIASLGTLFGLMLLYIGLVIVQPVIDQTYGLYISLSAPTLREVIMLAAIIIASGVVSLFPAIRAYRLSLADGMMVRT